MKQRHVLIIDDDEQGINVLAALLDPMGITYSSIQDPTTLDSIVDELHQFDIIFLDLEMPKLDGYEILEILKDDLQVEAPVVAYSSHTSEITVARDVGFNGLLGKPLRRKDFPDQVERILRGEKVWEID